MRDWWVHSLYSNGKTVLLVSWVFWVLFSITLHELAHGWAALWQGDDTPRRLKRMTMNPVVHMGPMSLIIFAVIGIAWGMMPTDPSNYRWRRKGRIVVAAAGPAMNLALALVSLTIAALWVRYSAASDPFYQNVYIFLMAGGMLNLVLAAFNLLPIPPLDGSQILTGMSFEAYRFYQNPQVQMFGMFALLAVFLSGIGGLLYYAANAVSEGYLDAVLAILP